LSSIKTPCRLMLLFTVLVILLFLSGCNEASSEATSSILLNIPKHPVIHTFDLSARQGLRDLAGDFSARASGADTGITVLPGEKVEIFASGSASVQPGRKQSGPEGLSPCPQSTMPEPSLPCYSVIYSVGITGPAGEVGTHTGFNPATAGNLFLGVNAPDAAMDGGSFHMTVLIIPSGTLAGVWAAPENGFTIQGRSMTLSAYVFAQNATIDTVQFTAAVPGQAPVPICETVAIGKDLFSCLWDFMLNGTYFHNGPITFGFTLNGSQYSGNSLEPTVNPDGIRTGVVRYVLTQSASFYAGYAATDLAQPGAYQKVTGHWTVPQAHCSPGETSLSGIWVGMTSDASDQSLLAQLGTDSDCQSGLPQYSMWWELFPAPSVPLDLPLRPGDNVTATVTFQQGKFHLMIDVPKEKAHFSTTQAGQVSDTSVAECITEAPTIIVDPATNRGHLAQLTNFGTVSIFCQLNNNEPIANGPEDILYQMQTDAGTAKATTSDLDQAGSTFTVQWHHG
jgi:hypothetical protein